MGRPTVLQSRAIFSSRPIRDEKKKIRPRLHHGLALSPLGVRTKVRPTKGDRLVPHLPDRWGPLGFPHDRKSSVPSVSERLQFAVSLLGVQATPGQPKVIGSPAPAG